MKKKIKIIGVASMLAIGLIVETGSAQTGHNTPIHKQQMHGNIKGGGMFNGGMVGMPSRKMIPAGNLRMMGSQRNQQNWVSLGCDSMTGNAMINRMSPGQQQEFLNQTVNLRKQMIEKRFDYIEAIRNPDTTFQNLAKIEKGMLELRIKMLDKMNIRQKE